MWQKGTGFVGHLIDDCEAAVAGGHSSLQFNTSSATLKYSESISLALSIALYVVCSQFTVLSCGSFMVDMSFMFSNSVVDMIVLC